MSLTTNERCSLKQIVPKQVERIEVEYSVNVQVCSRDKDRLLAFIKRVKNLRSIPGVWTIVQDQEDVPESPDPSAAEIKSYIDRIESQEPRC
jgi:hypothetical protein